MTKDGYVRTEKDYHGNEDVKEELTESGRVFPLTDSG